MSAQPYAPEAWRYLPELNIIGAPSVWFDEDGAHRDYRYPRVIAELPDDWDQSRHGPIIAAAPELLAIAQRILDRGYVSACIEEERNDHDALVAAIAKATGEA